MFVFQFPRILTLLTSIIVSQVITSFYYAYNICGKLQMDLRREQNFTPVQREAIAYDVPQSGPLASILTTFVLTLIVTNVTSELNINDVQNIIITSFVLWIGKP
ncbi:5671_t:CDS:2 [Cetraspora pellucida]|uniref:5671_t:CDS:1 n=1 Tax=Cetraspora pellucida TaxID=1433469 RepID=A0A9N8ZKA5_9GLOM|nr:5671_t:CDS:2 [Cetraspora pellucida]